MEKKKVVLAFSGGLDTSYCVKYLTEDCGYEVYTAIANTGGFNAQELKAIEFILSTGFPTKPIVALVSDVQP